MHDSPVDTDTWMIGLDSWVIQDGNYPDVVTGQRIDFALEFASRGGLRPMPEAAGPSVRWIAGSDYEVTAQIVHDKSNARVLDFGILAYHYIGIEDPEHRSLVGAWVTGEINLGVDPFFYVDELAREEGFPALVYSWTVLEVRQRRRDYPAGYVRIGKTDAWGDLDAMPSYLLRCRMEQEPRSTVRSDPGRLRDP